MLIILLFLVLSTLTAIVSTFIIPPLRVPKDTTREKKLAQLDSWLQYLHSQGKFHGVTLLSSASEVIFEKGYGFADCDEKIKLTRYSSFNLASVSKQFTAAGIILLKQRNELSYSDPLEKYIPELSFYNKVTIQHLLNHTSGIPDYLHIAFTFTEKSEIVTTEKLLVIYSEKKPKVTAKPGEKFQYNNMGYVLLAEIIARISGKSFSEYMYENIFQPCGMEYTRVFNLLSNEDLKNRVFGFRKKYFFFGKKQLSDLIRFDGLVGDGNIYSCAHDLFKWHKALLSSDIIPIKEISKAYKSGYLNNGKTTGYGYGWFINDNGSVEHAGSWQGFATYLFRNPINGQLIILLDNTGNIFQLTTHGGRYNSIPLNLQNFLNEL